MVVRQTLDSIRSNGEADCLPVRSFGGDPAMNIERGSEEVREVFARYGLAIYRAQCLERQLSIILATKYGPGLTQISGEELDENLEGLFARTLGRLVQKIKMLAKLGEEEEQQLQEALRKRNWLVHGYFWERAVELLSESGRASMIQELEEVADFFDTLDKVFTNRTMEWATTVGITEQSVDQELQRLIRAQNEVS